MAPNTLTRRTALSAMALAPVVVSVSAVAAQTGTQTPFRLAQTKYIAASKRFNALPSDMPDDQYAREEDAYLASVSEVDRTPVHSWDEFADAFKIACDDGDSLPSEKLVMKLLRDINRLTS